MKLLNSTPVTQGIRYSAGYTHGCSVTIVHGNPKVIPDKEKLHYHTKDSEYFYVLEGTLTVNVAGQDILIAKGQCLEAEPMEIHKIVKLGLNAEYIIVRTNVLPSEKVVIE